MSVPYEIGRLLWTFAAAENFSITVSRRIDWLMLSCLRQDIDIFCLHPADCYTSEVQDASSVFRFSLEDLRESFPFLFGALPRGNRVRNFLEACAHLEHGLDSGLLA